MKAKILFVSDLHKVCKEGSTIRGRITVQQRIQEDIIKYVKGNNVTHIVLLGDWYDRGFHDLCSAYGAIQEDIALSKAVSGNVYLCVGNHFFLERDDNPEMYVIQPNEYLKPKTPIKCPEQPIFKVVPELIIGRTQISFFHFNKTDKHYLRDRKDDIIYHIGVYHDDETLPTDIRQREGINKVTSIGYLSEIYKNVDLGIHGHIHCKVGVSSVNLANGKSIPVIIPGSLGITANSDKYKHTFVQLPVVEIQDNDAVSVTFADFETHLDQLRFYSKTEKKDMFNKENASVELVSSGVIQSLPTYLTSRGYPNHCLKLVSAVNKSELNITDAIRILTEDNNGL